MACPSIPNFRTNSPYRHKMFLKTNGLAFVFSHKNYHQKEKPMRPKRQIITLSLIALCAFGTIKAQDTNAKIKAPIVKKGDAGDATFASYNDRLAIHIIGRNDGKMPPKKYATMLANAFADPKYTDKPMYITVTYEKRDTAGETQAVIYMDGGDYKTKEGYNIFTPEQIGQAIKTISNIHVVKHGDKHVIKEAVPLLNAEKN